MLNYTIKGQGLPLIFLHGYLENLNVFEGFADKFTDSYKVVCIDLPGCGKSMTQKNQSIDTMANEVIKVLKKEKCNKSIIIGHSMGGYVGLSLMEKYSSHFTALCLLHSHAYADTEEKINNRLREIELIKKGKKNMIISAFTTNLFSDYTINNNSELINRIINISMKENDEGIIACLLAMAKRKNIENVLTNPNNKIIWVLGKYDNLINFKYIIDEYKSLSNIDFILLEKSGHMGFVEEQDLLTNILKNKLSNHLT